MLSGVTETLTISHDTPMPTTTHSKEETEELPTLEREERTTLSDNTKVRLGLVLTVAGLCVGTILGVTAYGAAKVSEFSTKLDNINMLLTRATADSDATQKQVSSHISDDQKEWGSVRNDITDTKARVSVIERSGSEKTRELEKQIQDLRRDFQVHEALSKQGTVK